MLRKVNMVEYFRQTGGLSGSLGQERPGLVIDLKLLNINSSEIATNSTKAAWFLLWNVFL